MRRARINEATHITDTTYKAGSPVGEGRRAPAPPRLPKRRARSRRGGRHRRGSARTRRKLLRRLRRLLRPPVAMRLHVGRSDEGDPADDLARGRPQCHHGDAHFIKLSSARPCAGHRSALRLMGVREGERPPPTRPFNPRVVKRLCLIKSVLFSKLSSSSVSYEVTSGRPA